LIPAAQITAWSQTAPWPRESQVEQDLILSRLMVEIANDELLGPELALRGGTCFHKLFLPRPLRYSEDLDYVRKSRSGVGPYLDALRVLTEGIGLVEQTREFSGPMVHAVFDAEANSGGPIRIKIEINTREVVSYLPRVTRSFGVDSPWWRGSAEVGTFAVEELMGTKLRALYQRSKGRDLFDLWLALSELDPAEQEIANALHHYMAERAFSFPQLAQNLRAKLVDPDFEADVQLLAVALPGGYELEVASDLLIERVGRHLRNAPKLDEIEGGRWRAPR
jgi:predicted nucleotidyltransferase component of viral defense system